MRSGVYSQMIIWRVQGVASVCNLDTEYQTFTWMEFKCVLLYLCAYACCILYMSLQYVCMLAACVHVSGDPGTCWWRNQVRVLLRSQAALLPRSLSHQSVILAGSHFSMPRVWLGICCSLCLSVCVSLVRSLILTQPQFQTLSFCITFYPFLSIYFFFPMVWGCLCGLIGWMVSHNANFILLPSEPQL